MYVAGSHTVRDWYDDVAKIPFWGDVKKSERYQQSIKMLTANPRESWGTAWVELLPAS